jgi:hypothetical protein
MKWGIVKRSALGDDWTAQAHLADAPVQAEPRLRTDHACTQGIGHGSACGDPAYTTRDGQWLCPAHADRRDWEAAHQDA